MRTVSLALIGGLLAVIAPLAADGPPRPLDEWYETAHLDGVSVGSLHTSIVRDGASGQRRTTSTLELTLRRYGSVARVRREVATTETADGQLTAVSMRQGAPGGKQLTLDGSVRDGFLEVKIDGGRIERRLRWPAGGLGLAGQETLFAARQPQPGDRFAFQRFDPTYNTVLNVRVVVTERESVEVNGTRRSLLRAELTPDRLEAVGASVQPAKTVLWLDDQYVIVRRQTDLEGLGTLVLTRAGRAQAVAPVTAGVDVGVRSLVPLDRAIASPYTSRSVLYRVTVRGEDDPARLVVSDDHQEVRNVRGSSFELLVHPVRPATRRAAGDDQAPAEYRASCRFLDHQDERIGAIARRAVGEETDPWRQAVRIEAWVKTAMRNDNRAELVPASEVARTLRGDCRHHALLTAALGRAVGLGSRTAIGLLYVHRGGPRLGFHMWTEVYIDGKWVGIDSTLGRGGVSATHVKVTEHSWAGVESLTPLLPVERLLGKLQVEVLRGS